MTKPTDIDKNATAASRRRFLRESGALSGGAFIAGGLAGSEARAGSANTANHAPNVPEWMKPALWDTYIFRHPGGRRSTAKTLAQFSDETDMGDLCCCHRGAAAASSAAASAHPIHGSRITIAASVHRQVQRAKHAVCIIVRAAPAVIDAIAPRPADMPLQQPQLAP